MTRSESRILERMCWSLRSAGLLLLLPAWLLLGWQGMRAGALSYWSDAFNTYRAEVSTSGVSQQMAP